MIQYNQLHHLGTINVTLKKTVDAWTGCTCHKHPEFKDRSALNSSRIIKWVINFSCELLSKVQLNILHTF